MIKVTDVTNVKISLGGGECSACGKAPGQMGIEYCSNGYQSQSLRLCTGCINELAEEVKKFIAKLSV